MRYARRRAQQASRRARATGGRRRRTCAWRTPSGGRRRADRRPRTAPAHPPKRSAKFLPNRHDRFQEVFLSVPTIGLSAPSDWPSRIARKGRKDPWSRSDSGTPPEGALVGRRSLLVHSSGSTSSAGSSSYDSCNSSGTCSSSGGGDPAGTSRRIRRSSCSIRVSTYPSP